MIIRILEYLKSTTQKMLKKFAGNKDRKEAEKDVLQNFILFLSYK